MEKRIQTLISTAQKISLEPYPDSIVSQTNQDIEFVQQKWNKFSVDAKNTRQLIDLANEYFRFCDRVSNFFFLLILLE